MIYSFTKSEMADIEVALKIAIDQWKEHAEKECCLVKSEIEMFDRWLDFVKVCESIDN